MLIVVAITIVVNAKIIYSMKHNFSAAMPSLPLPVREQLVEALQDYQGTGVSICDLSHRSDEFAEIRAQIINLAQQVFKIPESHTVILTHGGARTQFALLPINFATAKHRASYLITGHWSAGAAAAAAKYAPVNSIHNTSNTQVNASWQINKNSAYVHYCPNETINGLQFNAIPDTAGVPLIADMTSCLGMENISLDKFAGVYASSQKNLGIAGVCLLIIKKDLIAGANTNMADIFSYAVLDKALSLYNTPSTLAWFTLLLMLQWMGQQGGIGALEAINKRRAQEVYNAIDSSGLYTNHIHSNNRSSINIPFTLATPELEEKFIAQAHQAGLMHLKGHKISGGIRVSLYNSITDTAISQLLDFMDAFVKHNS
jgi:phosphoserine aminotransferase